MKVRDVMTRDLKTIGPQATLWEAAATMKEFRVGVLPVCDGDQLSGLVTDRDITIRGIADGKDPSKTPVQEIMSPHPTYCFEDDDTGKAEEQMAEQQVRRLPVLSEDKRLVGIVSLGDLAVGGDEKKAGEALEQISRPVRS